MPSGVLNHNIPFNEEYYQKGRNKFFEYKEDTLYYIYNLYDETNFPFNENIHSQRHSFQCGYQEARLEYLNPHVKEFFNKLDKFYIENKIVPLGEDGEYDDSYKVTISEKEYYVNRGMLSLRYKLNY